MKSLVFIAVLSFLTESTFLAAAPQPDPGINKAEVEHQHRMIIGLVEYIHGDYSGAVADGKILSVDEFNEMKSFSATASNLFHQEAVKAQGAENQALFQAIGPDFAKLEDLIKTLATKSAIEAHTAQLKDRLVALFAIPQAPTEAPNFANGQRIYAQVCASCHGADGHGDGDAGKGSNPPPKSFFDDELMTSSSPFKFFNTFKTGVDGTSMRAFTEMPETDLWSLAFYVFTLRLTDRPGTLPQGLSAALALPDLTGAASQSDAELVTDWRKAAPDLTPAQEQELLIYVRKTLPYQTVTTAKQDPIAASIALTLGKLDEAAAYFKDGAHEKAALTILDGYLEGFEKIEGAMRVTAPDRVAAVERRAMELRGFAGTGDAAGFATALAAMRGQLNEILAMSQESKDGSTWSARASSFVSAFVIIFREGLEAFLIVSALLALLTSLGAFSLRRWVHAGWISALACGFLTYWLFEYVLMVSGAVRESLEAFSGLLAVGLLFYTGFWLLSQTEHRRWAHLIRAKTDHALNSGRMGSLFMMAFIAVYREAAETVLFFGALASKAPSPAFVGLGFVAGVIVLTATFWGIMKFQLRLPLKQFFYCTSGLMIVLAIVLAGKTTDAMIAAGYLNPRPIAGMGSVDILGIYPDSAAIASQIALLAMGLAFSYAIFRKKNLKAV